MAVYAIGDVQGCHDALLALLAHVGFDPARDRLWFAGDLVNRGPRSTEVLRFVRDLGERAVTVLGNHDLHLLAVGEGARPLRRKDTFAQVLEAPDAAELLGWLRRQPLLHRDAGLGYTLVHAGLAPQWSIAEAQRRAAELERALRAPGWHAFLAAMYGDDPVLWSEQLSGSARLRFITNAFTRMRYCDAAGRLDLAESGPPGSQPAGLMPWYEVPARRNAGERILFGHWATLDLTGPIDPRHRVHHLDTGCVWGGRLTAMRLEDGRRFSVPCAEGPAGAAQAGRRIQPRMRG